MAEQGQEVKKSVLDVFPGRHPCHRFHVHRVQPEQQRRCEGHATAGDNFPCQDEDECRVGKVQEQVDKVIPERVQTACYRQEGLFICGSVRNMRS